MPKKRVNFKLIWDDKTWLTLSNLLTIARIAAAPVMVWLVACQAWEQAFVLFVAAALSDTLDGQLARVFNDQTNLGRLLDPIADKIFLLSSFASFAYVASPRFAIPIWFVHLLLWRELIMIAGAAVLLVRGKGADLQPQWWGKLSTLLQIVFIGWMFVCHFAQWYPIQTYQVVLDIIAGFAVISFLQYVWYALKVGR